MKKIIFTGFVVIWMIFIFVMSHQPAEESTDTSLKAGRLIATILIPDYSEWTEAEQIAFAEKIDHPVRKTAHAMEYALMGMLCLLMYGSYGIVGRKWFFLGWFTSAFYACTDEFHQLFVAGRSGQISDVLLDSAGALLGCLFIVCVKYVIKILKKKQS